jgi:hypothetical protein
MESLLSPKNDKSSQAGWAFESIDLSYVMDARQSSRYPFVYWSELPVGLAVRQEPSLQVGDTLAELTP